MGSFYGNFTLEDQYALNLLRAKKKKILDHLLLTWKLKSRNDWVLYGDSNTKFFHAIASDKRNHKTIWSLVDEERHTIEEEHELKELGSRHFVHVFSDDRATCILTDQLQVVSLYPTMIAQDYASSVIAPVTLMEIQQALKSFKKDRIPSPDG